MIDPSECVIFECATNHTFFRTNHLNPTLQFLKDAGMPAVINPGPDDAFMVDIDPFANLYRFWAQTEGAQLWLAMNADQLKMTLLFEGLD